MQEILSYVFGLTIALAILVGAFFGIGYMYKNYKVWSMEMDGRARLAEAEWSKQIATEEAKAVKDSATYRAQAEVERARGVAEANSIISGSLKGNEEYLRYLWIEQLSNTEGQVIYVPTEAGLPVLEAGKRQ